MTSALRLRRLAIQNSALWAAYGDALGFITELADEKRLARRAGVSFVKEPIPWKRRIGGRFGADIELPAGTYSDDTQLRLATSRSLRGDGTFDAEAFAKVELTVWPSYSLGGGRGTKTAAANLTKKDVNWFSNFFDEKRSTYVQGGGNGAAMRIQPHVWAARGNVLARGIVRDVLRNALATHGHTRGFAGAYFHAACLSYALTERRIPEPDQLLAFAADIRRLEDLIRSDNYLGTIWLPTWEERNHIQLGEALSEVEREVSEMINGLQHASGTSLEETYGELLRELDAKDPATRGSGTKTSVLAALLAWLGRDDDPMASVLVAANALGSDTDTIATMLGALLGAVSEEPPPQAIQDQEYVSTEADRLFEVSTGGATKSFGYPDVMSWNPPKHQVDAVGLVDGELALAGIGFAVQIGPPTPGHSKRDAVWQWLKLDFGQTIAAKRRHDPEPLGPEQFPSSDMPAKPTASRSQPTSSTAQGYLFDDQPHSEPSLAYEADLDSLTQEVIANDFPPRLIGEHLLFLSGLPKGMEMCVAYAATISKARIARRARKKNNVRNNE